MGEVHNLCCFAVHGELIAVHEYHSIRRREGLGVFRKIVTPRPDLVQHTRDLLRGLDWEGIAHVAFFVSHDGLKKWYMETNGRFWASTEGSVHAGWDFPILGLQILSPRRNAYSWRNKSRKYDLLAWRRSNGAGGLLPGRGAARYRD